MLMLILIMPQSTETQLYFNTSHVNVNLCQQLNILIAWENFNTSHVNVNLEQFRIKINTTTYFNTSHVNVNRASPCILYICRIFQYISC